MRRNIFGSSRFGFSFGEVPWGDCKKMRGFWPNISKGTCVKSESLSNNGKRNDLILPETGHLLQLESACDHQAKRFRVGSFAPFLFHQLGVQLQEQKNWLQLLSQIFLLWMIFHIWKRSLGNILSTSSEVRQDKWIRMQIRSMQMKILLSISRKSGQLRQGRHWHLIFNFRYCSQCFQM